MTGAQHNVTTHRGCPLRWEARGTGPPVVLIQGVGVGRNGWRPQVDVLAGRYRCLTFDNRGYGDSRPACEALTVELLATDVLALMDAQGWRDAHLVGHSLGGLIALQTALLARDRVRSLALLCTFGSGAVPTRLTWPILAAGLRTRIGSRRARRHAFLRLVLAPEERAALTPRARDALAARLADLFGRDLADQPAVIMDQLRCMRGEDLLPRLAGLDDVPCLVVSAEYDIIAPPSAGRELAAAIRGARYVEFDGAAHGMTVTAADRLNSLLLEHLDVAGARPAA
jgi:pimeloyl-ACP methyl ester carboxylesterase